MRKLILIGCILLVSFVTMQGQDHHILDTVMLEEVVHYGDIKKYQSGAKTQQISSGQIRLAQEGGISNTLMRFAPVYIKSDAGGLSTIRFRGTSPNHTSVNFGGLNINSLTLGHSNLSNIPAFLFDGINIQYGGSSAVNGSGSIGGALYLGLSENWANGVKITAKSSAGSFGEYLNGAKVFAGNGKWESVTRVYLFQKKNNFPFQNLYTGEVGDPGTVEDIQKGASIKNMGLLQEVNYRFDGNEFFKSSFWIENCWRQVQPNMQTNYHYTGTQEIDDDNFRAWIEYRNHKSAFKYKAGIGFVHDMEVYDNIETQKIGSKRLVAEAQVEHDFTRRLGGKLGAKYKYIKPEVYAYADSLINHEERLGLFSSLFFQASPHFRITLNLRQMFVSDFKAPFTPSLGAEYTLRSGDYSYFKLTSALSRSYRIPTFNDRYWGTQGNPSLKPESGKNFELGGLYAIEKEGLKTTVSVNAFYMDVENWIEWRNFGVWMAQNVLEVVSKGVEVQSTVSFPLGKANGDFILNYTWNQVEPVKDIGESATINRQMNYVPEHIGNAYFAVKYRKWEFVTDGQLTGGRYTDDFGFKLDPYFLLNCTALYNFKIQQHSFTLSLSSNNILDTDYQNQRYYAMHGRSFRLSVNYELAINK